MEHLKFANMDIEHAIDVMKILNHYIKNSYAAYAEQELPIAFFDKLLEMSKGYPSFVIKSNECVVGFCLLKAYNSFSTFKGNNNFSIAPFSVT